MDATNPKLLSLLRKIAVEQNYPNYTLEVMPTHTGGANYTSRLYRVSITGVGKADLRLFAKIATMSEEMRDQTPLKPYENERFVYTELARVYKNLEKKRGLSEGHKLAFPKYYSADETYLQEILVLEDLASKGYEQHSRFEPISWVYATAAVTELAKFHALSMDYQHEDPVGFYKSLQMFQKGLLTDNEGNKAFYNSSVKSALGAIRQENKEKLQVFLDGTDLSKFCNMFGALRHSVLIHLEFRPSNLLHRMRHDAPVDVVIVDYQTVQAGSPVIDLLYFIFTATDGQFRAKYYQQLVDYYHSELGNALARLGLDIEDTYSRADFEFELREKLPFGLMVSVLMLPCLLLAEECAPQLDEEMNMARMAILNTGARYVRRINEAVDDFMAWGVI